MIRIARVWIVRLFIIIVFLFILWHVVIYSISSGSHVSEKEKQKVLTENLGRKLQLSPIATRGNWIQYYAHTVSFAYPSQANVVSHDRSNVFLDNIAYTVKSDHITVVIQVLLLPNLFSLDQYNQVILRKKQPTLYTGEAVRFGDNQGIHFIKQDIQNEESYFYLINGHVYSFVFSGIDEEILKNYIDKTLSSLVFFR